MSTAGLLMLGRHGSSNGPVAWPAPPREPLPPFPEATADQPGPPQASAWSNKGDYVRELPSTIPSRPDRRFHRGNPIGPRIPGYTAGENDKDRSLDCTWNWTRRSDADMRTAVDWHADGCGHTHASLSLPQAWNQYADDRDAAHDALVRVMQYVQTKIPFISLNVASDAPSQQGFDTTRPWCDKLIEAGALRPGIDIVVACWQINKWYGPVDGIQLIIDVGQWARQHDLLHYVHWGGGYDGWTQNCAMWNEETAARWGITDRWSFNRVLVDLDGPYYQCDTEADIDQVQSGIAKVCEGMRPDQNFVYAEGDMQAESDTPLQRLEVYGDLKAFLAQCAPSHGIPVSSFNGSRGRDGRVILPLGGTS